MIKVTLSPIEARAIIDAADLTDADPESPLVQGVLRLMMKLEQHDLAQRYTLDVHPLFRRTR